MYNNKKFVILSSVDWDTHKQLHHALTKHLTDSGYSVLFVENTGTRSLKITDIDRVKRRLQNVIKSRSGFTKISNNLTIFTPIFIPFHFNFIFKKINNLIVISRIISWIKKNNFENPIVINFLPNPITENIIKSLNASTKIYYMADNMTLNSPNRKEMEVCEKTIMGNSDYIFYTSEILKNKFKTFKKNSEILSSGVDYSKYNIKKKNNKKFVIGYIGAIREIIDEKLILKISKDLPNCEIRLVGPELTNFNELKSQKNIKFLGKVSHRKIPETLSHFDIGIIPYKVNLFTNSIYPLKLNEYLAAGLPVVTTKIKTLHKFDKENPNVIKVNNNSKEFIKSINQIRFKKLKFNKKKIKSIAKENTWNKKFVKFDEKIDHLLFEKTFYKQNLKEKLLALYNKKKFNYFNRSIFFGLIISVFVVVLK